MAQKGLILVGVLTWLVIAATTPVSVASSIALLLFLGLFLFTTRDTGAGTINPWLLAAQTVVALAVLVIAPGHFVAILLVIVAGQLGHFPARVAMIWIVIQTAILGVILARVDRDDALPMTLAYFTFQLFGAFAARMAHEERDAKQALAEANAELRVATGLLEMSSRAEERLRIARELHDLIGHHLTALSLNLEVASHLTSGEAREQIEKSKSLTKLLLSDVRDTVSRLREDEPVDLAAALRSIRDAVPSPAIHVDAPAIDLTDATIAQTALRAVQEIVTNAVRHSGARNLWLALRSADHALTIDARDDGSGTDHVQFGNGLRGMRERVQQSGGTIDVASARGRGFEVHIRLPFGSAA